MRRSRQIIGATVLWLLLAGCAAEPIDRPVGELTIETVHTNELLITGPAFGRDPEPVNRMGSHEVPIRVYTTDASPWLTLVWAHGGSFTKGTLDWPEADWAARRFAEQGIRVVSVEYVLASDTVKAPAPANDVAAVAAWAATNFDEPLVLGGASAGANLATQAALMLPRLSTGPAESPSTALILLYPTLHRVQQTRIEIETLVADLPQERRFTASRIAQMYDFYLGSPPEHPPTPLEQPTDMPTTHSQAIVVGELQAEALHQLPPTVIVNAEADELRASGEQFAAQLRDAQVRVVQHTEPGTVHGYMNRPEENSDSRARAQSSIDRFVRELRNLITSS